MTSVPPAPDGLTSRDFPVLWPVLTRWADNDMFGHLNNAVYYQLFDTAINGWIQTNVELDPVTTTAQGIVAESGCRYFSELHFPQRLVIGLAVTRLGRSSVTYRLGVFRAAEELAGEEPQAVAALGHWVHVYVDRTSRRPVPVPDAIRSLLSTACVSQSASAVPRYASAMPVLSKTVEVAASAASILAIVADFEAYPQWNEEIKGLWVLARYDDGRPSQLRLDAAYEAIEDTLIQAVYYPGANQIQTVMQQGDLFAKQEQLFSVVETGATSLLTVDMDVEPSMPIPAPMVKTLVGNVLDYLAENLKKRAEELASSS